MGNRTFRTPSSRRSLRRRVVRGNTVPGIDAPQPQRESSPSVPPPQSVPPARAQVHTQDEDSIRGAADQFAPSSPDQLVSQAHDLGQEPDFQAKGLDSYSATPSSEPLFAAAPRTTSDHAELRREARDRATDADEVYEHETHEDDYRRPRGLAVERQPESQPPGHASDHDDALLISFFSKSPTRDYDDHEPYQVPMSATSRRAMWASLGIFAVSIIGIGGYTAYHQLIMPTPVELGSDAAPIATVVPPTAAEMAPPARLDVEREPRAVSRDQANTTTAQGAAGLRAGAVVPADQDSPTSSAPGLASDGLEPEAVRTAALQNNRAQQGLDDDAVAPAAAQANAVQTEADALSTSVGAQPPSEPSGVDSAPSAAPVVRATAVGVRDVPMLAPSYDELISVGVSFARKGRNREALEAYQRALNARPTAAAALAGIAYVHLNSGDNALAKVFAQRAVESDPTNSQGWIVLGAALDQLGDRTAAREAYRRCASDGVGSYVLECRRLSR